MRSIKIKAYFLTTFLLCQGYIAMADQGGLCFAEKTTRALAYAESIGLDANQHLLQYVQALQHGSMDSNEACYQLTYSILLAATYGESPVFEYNGIKTKIDPSRISQATQKTISDQDWRYVAQRLEPDLPIYKSLKISLQQYAELDRKEQSHNRKDIVARLQAYGIGTGDTASAIKNFQKLVDLDTTGVADIITIKELAVPISTRIYAIKKSLNTLRWIYQIPESQVVWVNIPAAQLRVISKTSDSVINMKVILGKVSWQTPTFASYIDGITTYPYWIVPKRIAVKEILPKVKYNPGLLDANNIQVLDRYGRIVPSGKIAWHRLSSGYFPYTLRQSTGCDNSLGVMMFNINSPYSIFLHDTNAKDLFNNKRRYLSHGCIRVESPLALAQAITNDEISKITINKLNSCLKDQVPGKIELSNKVPVIVTYLLAGTDENNTLHFYQDVYGKMK